MSTAQQRWLALWAGVLTAVLCLGFLPCERWLSLLITGVIWAAIGLFWYQVRRQTQPHTPFGLDALPPPGYRQPVVLVCGDSPGDWPEASRVLTVSQGCWIKVDEPQELLPLVSQLLGERPAWGRQLAVMITLCPQWHADSAALTRYLLAWRWQLSLLRRHTGIVIPLVLSTRLGCAMTPLPLWQVTAGSEATTLWQETASPAPADGGIHHDDSRALAQQVVTRSLMAWSTEYVYACFTENNPEIPPIAPDICLLGSGPALEGVVGGGLWTEWLTRYTGIVQADGWQPLAGPRSHDTLLPDIILPLLPAGQGITPRQRLCCRAVALLLLACTGAVLCSGWNNSRLVRTISVDLTRYAALPVTEPAKATAVEVLRQHAAQLDSWARQGAPWRFSLGLYQGEKLRIPLFEAIGTYQPPPPPPPPEVDKQPQIIRLDSMSLFDSGKAELKPDSTRLLVNSLVGIKAKPGWLIVVAGHTDSTGNASTNQQLSLKRAGSVRDWMRDTGDVPESCFAVQGYGADRPIASNDTTEGRTRNRRVEISLVPQADACRLPGEPPASSQDDDVSHNEME